MLSVIDEMAVRNDSDKDSSAALDSIIDKDNCAAEKENKNYEKSSSSSNGSNDDSKHWNDSNGSSRR